jgi:internalin A
MMSELALQLIEKEKQERTGTLNLSFCGLTEIPEAVSELTWLTTLIIGNRTHKRRGREWEVNPNQGIKNKIVDLTLVATLHKLQHFNCSNLPVSDLRSLSHLNNLQRLNCSSTLVLDISVLSNLSNLVYLNFAHTPITNILPLTALTNLQVLVCSSTLVSDITPLRKLKFLSDLFMANTQIRYIETLSHLPSLNAIHCGNSLVQDLRPILKKLRKNLQLLWSINTITNSRINIQNCPLICPPVEFAIEGHHAVMEYFDQLEQGSENLNELKIIFLGEGAAGKTSLIRRLRKEPFDPKESQTHGIRIRKTCFEIENESIDAYLWDFGGQEVMHATHQFFLSQRCIYVLVLNSRTDDKAEYWLKHASSFGGKSPVLVVLNKIDENPAFEVNRKVLSEKYPQIQGYYRISCKNDQGMLDFEQALREQITQSDTRRTPFPTSWLAVKEHFTAMERDYIESNEYRDVCLKQGVDQLFSQNVLLQFLHDLGVIINFRNLKNFDTQILNPLWLTNGVYRIINSEKIATNKGLLYENELDEVINDPRYTSGNTTEKIFHYPCNKLNYIVRIMQEFELCFPLDHKSYVIPQLLPIEEPEFDLKGAVLHFVVKFPEFLPDSIFPRLMVKLHSFIKKDLRWRSGMVLAKPSVFKAESRIRADKEDKTITLDVCGAEPRRLLSFIRETLKEIIGGFTDLPFEEMAQIPETKELWDYQWLVEMEKAGEKEFFVPQLRKRIRVTDMLDGVEEPSMRDIVAQLLVKAFISYSHKDVEHMQVLQAALSPLVRLNNLKLWCDHDIDAGEAWEKEIMQQLEEADLILCLVSHDFIKSDFCYKQEFLTALEAHQRGEKTIVPIRLRSCNWDNLPLAKIQGRPDTWITSASNQDEAWTQVAKGLEPVVKTIQKRRKEKWNSEKDSIREE